MASPLFCRKNAGRNHEQRTRGRAGAYTGYNKEGKEETMRICEIKCREVINIRSCRRLGYVGDVDFDLEKGCILAIIVPGPATICGFLGREKEYVIPYWCIKQVGPDIILVDVDEKEVTGKCGP